jgi:hypothetical protein
MRKLDRGGFLGAAKENQAADMLADQVVHQFDFTLAVVDAVAQKQSVIWCGPLAAKTCWEGRKTRLQNPADDADYLDRGKPAVYSDLPGTVSQRPAASMTRCWVVVGIFGVPFELWDRRRVNLPKSATSIKVHIFPPRFVSLLIFPFLSPHLKCKAFM